MAPTSLDDHPCIIAAYTRPGARTGPGRRPRLRTLSWADRVLAQQVSGSICRHGGRRVRVVCWWWYSVLVVLVEERLVSWQPCVAWPSRSPGPGHGRGPHTHATEMGSPMRCSPAKRHDARFLAAVRRGVVGRQSRRRELRHTQPQQGHRASRIGPRYERRRA